MNASIACTKNDSRKLVSDTTRSMYNYPINSIEQSYRFLIDYCEKTDEQGLTTNCTRIGKESLFCLENEISDTDKSCSSIYIVHLETTHLIFQVFLLSRSDIQDKGGQEVKDHSAHRSICQCLLYGSNRFYSPCEHKKHKLSYIL